MCCVLVRCVWVFAVCVCFGALEKKKTVLKKTKKKNGVVPPVSAPNPIFPNRIPTMAMLVKVDAGFYRIAAALAATPKTIPHIIVQTGRSWETALAQNERYMLTWWYYNPDFEYRFYNDSQERAVIASMRVNSIFQSIDAPALDGVAAHEGTPQAIQWRAPHRQTNTHTSRHCTPAGRLYTPGLQSGVERR